ncbi:MAG: Ig-like domain-containing protein [Adhaeribacter sp.]
MTVKFSEPVTGFAIGDILVTGGSKGTLSGSGDTYTFNITPSPLVSTHQIKVDVAASVALDASLNGNTAATQLVINYDGNKPTVVLTAPTAANPTNLASIPVTVKFNEPVTGFDIDDIVVAGGVKGTLSGSGDTYTFNITPDPLVSTHQIKVDVAADVAKDAATNDNTAATQLVINYDGNLPTVVLTAPAAANPTNLASIPVTVKFNEPVTGFDIDDIVVAGGVKGTLSGSGDTYTFNITPDPLLSTHTITVDVAADVAQDAATNDNTAAAQLVINYDGNVPTVVLTAPTAADPTNLTTIPVTVKFSEPVTGFTIGDILVTGGTKGTLSGSGDTYTFDITPSPLVSTHQIKVNVAAAVAKDAATNDNTAASQLVINYDGNLPTVVLTAPTAANPTNLTSIPVTVKFNEPVTGFDIDGIVVSGGVKGTLSGSGDTYTFNITPDPLLSTHTITVDVAANVAQDAATNDNTAATQLVINYDGNIPAVVLTAPTAADPTNLTTIPVTVKFSEPVTGFDIGDIVVDGGVKGTLSGSGDTYTFNITPNPVLGTYPITVDVAATVAQDASLNGNTAAAQLVINYDGNKPTVVLTAPTAADPTNLSTIPVTVTFNEPVTGFDIDDIVVAGGVKGTLSGSGTTYTFDITPSPLVSTHQIKVNVAAAVAKDAATNDNTAATQLVINYDGNKPTVVLTAPTAANPTNLTSIPVTVKFNEPVTGFDIDDIVIAGGVKGTLSGSDDTYTFNITPDPLISTHQIKVDVAANVAQDAATNDNTAATQLVINYDGNLPTVVLTAPTAADPTNLTTIPVTVKFSEPVTGFAIGDILVTGGTKGTLSGSGDTFTFNITPSPLVSTHQIKVDIAAAVAKDAATNDNSAATQLVINYDGNKPTVVLTAPTAANPTNLASIPVTVTFNEPVTGFDIDDIIVSGGVKGTLSGSGTTYTFDITPSPLVSTHQIKVNVAANVAQDAATNDNTAATQLVINYDGNIPSVVLTAPTAANPTNLASIPVTVKFSEPVTGFDIGDIVVSGGVKGTLSGTGDTYTFNITPSPVVSTHPITVDVAAAVAQDASLNGNTTATQLVINYDGNKPTVVLTAPTAADPTNLTSIPVTVKFSEPVTGFAIGDILVTGGTKGTLSGSGDTYTFNITPSPLVSTHQIKVDVAAAVAKDAATNDNSAATQLVINYDGNKPTVVLTAPTAANPTNLTSIPVTVTFNELVTGFDIDDIVVTGGVKGALSGSGNTYTFDITPSPLVSTHQIKVDVAANVAQDASLNGNTAAAQLVINYDGNKPTVVLTAPTAPDPTNLTSIPVTVKFSEPVTGFAIGDIVVTGGTKGSLSGSGDTYTFNITPSPLVSTHQIKVDVAAAVARDAATNDNVAAAQLVINYDGNKPTVVLTAPTAPDPTNLTSIPVTVKFSEPVSGFAIGDIVVTGGTKGTLSGSGDTYTFHITPSPAASTHQIKVDVAANVAQDASLNGNTAAAQLGINYDGTKPAVTLQSTAPNPVNTSFLVTIAFTEGVSGFDASDLAVSNATFSNFTAINPTTYQVTIVPVADGPVKVGLAAGVAADAAGNGNTAATELSRIYDATAPTVQITSAAPALINTPFTARFVFSEAMTGFALGDMKVTNGIASAFTAISATEYTALITPAGQGQVLVGIPALAATDAAGNGNLAAADLTRIFDNLAPGNYALAFNQARIDGLNQTNASLRVTGAEVGATYFYSISSSNGGTPVTGTALTTAAAFDLLNLDLSKLADGLLTASFYQQDNTGNRGQTVEAKVTKLSKDIAAVAALAQLSVPFRTTYGQLSLPAQVEVTFLTGEKALVAVTWAPGSYNGNTPGAYTLNGKLTLPAGTTNQNNREALVTVLVLPNKAPTALTLDNAIFAPNIHGTDGRDGVPEAFGTFSTTDEDDSQHTYSLVNGLGAINNDLFEIIGNKIYLKSNRGLYGQKTFKILVRTTDPANNTFDQVFTITKGLYVKGDMEIVNAFTPNGDGYNDVWIIPELRFFNDVEIEVFDRSGIRLFRTTNPEQGWDGRAANGTELKGPFLFVLHIKEINFVKKGVVTILKH